MTAELSAAPVLSTPAEHVFEYAVASSSPGDTVPPKSDDEVRKLYEIERTAKEVRQGGWKRIALQFPDHMLGDGPRVVEVLNAELRSLPTPSESPAPAERIYILADTSYSACCVDEIAAEHADADVVVHYGRSCLSPTSRLPVIYVFTHHALDHPETLAAFAKQYPNKATHVILMADVTYQDHIPSLASELHHTHGYTNLLSTTVIHDPSGAIPNRKLVHPGSSELTEVASSSIDLKSHQIFHISTPPTSLLLVLASRVQDLHICPTPDLASPDAPSYSPTRLLGRRYARLLSLASAGIIGILVNTLSVSNYLESIDALRKQIAAAGKKSYTVVVGKLNPAKLANFAEVDGWVVVGCWESGLVEDDAGFFKPVITPFELRVALMGDEKRVWGGDWWGGIEGVQGDGKVEEGKVESGENGEEGDEEWDEDESAPPDFDLRTGKLITHARPMRTGVPRKVKKTEEDKTIDGKSDQSSSALAVRSKGELAMVNGVVSPGAEFLRSQRTWQGLGSDHVAEESTAIEEGRSGVARGYTVGDAEVKR
ncbi:putative diphthamide synthesis protein-domain-containing protein [Chaetomium sp. MPI-SDFR-AT-0129]|nr:putative diphthamide synthesis protein-domain-containing protein [Chaetomium sp. MPI-SDFR-AT-0129]